MDPRLAGVLLALSAAASWATAIVLYKALLREELSSYGLNLVNLSLYLAVFLVPLIFSRSGRMTSDVAEALVLSGVLGMAVGDTLFFEGLKRLTPHLIMTLTFLGQALVILLAVFYLGERQAGQVWAGIVLTMAGLALVAWPAVSKEGAARATSWGIMLGVCAVVCESVSIVIAKRALANVTAVEGTALRMAGAVAGLLAAGLLRPRLLYDSVRPVLRRKTLAGMALAVPASCLAFWFLHLALKRADASVVNTLNHTTPIFSIPLTYWVLKEKVERVSIAGILVAFAGVALIAGLR